MQFEKTLKLIKSLVKESDFLSELQSHLNIKKILLEDHNAKRIDLNNKILDYADPVMEYAEERMGI